MVHTASLATEPGLSQQALIDLVRQCDEDAARELVRELYPLVIKIVRAHLPRRVSEEDLAQTIFMKVFAALGQYSGRVPLQNWVSRIAVNTCFNQLQSERIRPELRWADLSEEEAAVLDTLASTGDDELPCDQLAARELVEKMLKRLPYKDRVVVVLLHLEQKSVDEIVQITGWTRAMIKIRAFRARSKLRKHLAILMKEHTHA